MGQFSVKIPLQKGQFSVAINKACSATGLGRTKLYELIGNGSLTTTTIGRRRLVLVESLRALLEPSNIGG